MSIARCVTVWGALVLSFSPFCMAQKADAAFVVGGAFVSDSNVVLTIPCALPIPGCSPTPFNETVMTGSHIFFEGVGAFRVVNAKALSLHLEVPVAGIPSQKVTFTGAFALEPHQLSSVFITPSLRVKLLPSSPISPWGSIGGGWAHYSSDVTPANNKGALQFGGGLDFKTPIPHLAFRAEVRDFVTSQPDPGIFLFLVHPQGRLHHHSLLTGGGVVLAF
ncbi:MAG TPA: hypothetical protein VKE93_04355 [Candidatus Angelobacter sp.]|nr:hypothetical protein [Candidatus Angelobacter sp.]